MVNGIVTRGFLYWLRAPRNKADKRVDEWILAIIRLALSVCLLAAIIRPNSIHDLRIYEAVSLSYLGYSLLIIVVLRVRSQLLPFPHLALHLIDILWATQLICLIEWPTLFFALFIFVMASTAFRYGFWEAQLTFAAFLALLTAGCYVHDPDLFYYWLSKGPRDIIPEFLLCFGGVCMAGLMAEAKAARSERQDMARIIDCIHIEPGMEPAIRAVITEGRRLFGATQVLMALQDRKRVSLFRVVRSQDALQKTEVEASQQAQYSFPPPGISVRLATGHPAAQSQLRCHMLAEGKMKRSKTDCGLPEAFLAAHPFRVLLVTAIAFEDNRTVRVYLIDPSRYLGGVAGLRFLDGAVRQMAPIFRDMFFVDRLARKARAAASSHMARELHDGVIQSLCSINMQIEELLEQSGPHLAPGNSLADIQRSIQKEIAALRDFIQLLRSVEVDAGQLLGFLSGMTMKFQGEHGIKARFVSEVDEVRLPSRVCTELTRIAQEALTNVRKHSKADEALIRFSRRNGDWVLSVMDNGCGFGFIGRRSHEELQASGEGPLILMERASVIGGKVCIESFEGSGSCLEVTIPDVERI